MKKLYFLVVALCVFNGLTAQIVTIPDAYFKEKLLAASSSNATAKDLAGNYFKIDSNFNNQIELSEALQVSNLNVSGSTISSLQGVLSFTNLQNLNCSYNQIKLLDLGGLTNLQILNCSNNQINSLGLGGLTNLQILDCQINYLASINLSGLTNLQNLNCSSNNFTSLNVADLINLQILDCHNNSSYIGTLDLSGLTSLKQLNCSNISLSTLITNGLINLQQLDCSDNGLTELNLKDLINLVNLNCSINYIVTLDISNFVNLQVLNCSNNSKMKSLNVKGAIQLQNLNCRANPLESIDLNGLTSLTNINLDYNRSLLSLYMKEIGFDSTNPTHTFDFNTQFALRYICASPSLIPYMQQRANQYGYNPMGYCLVIDSSCSSDPYNEAIVAIPDLNFKNSLLNSDCIYVKVAKDLAGNYCRVDKNLDGQIQVSEAANISVLSVGSSQPITSLIGISSFVNLNNLYCSQLNLTSLDLKGLKYLTYIECFNNKLTTLDITGLKYLTYLFCDNNQLTQLNLSGLTNLKSINCSFNKLSLLNVSGLSNLTVLECYGNLFSTIDLSGLTNLQDLRCSSNPLTSLSLASSPKIQYLSCGNSSLTSLDVSNLSNLTTLFCGNSFLKTLFMKNGINETNLDFSNNPNLKYICADDTQTAIIEAQIITNKMSGCTVNSYCSFTPGGTFYTIQGNNKLDTNSNGCDVLDIPFPNLKFNITSGTTTGSFISGATGNYSIPVQAGTHTITPKFENPTYFTVSPTTVNVTFPTQFSPVTQDFCISGNGIRPDLEITLLPLQPAVPGFDTKYKLVYKNKGNQTQSGSVNLSFNDAVLDFVASNPIVSTQTLNNLSWNFINLLPFETREITFTVNVNSPMETPAVNSGSVLVYNATITSTITDETPTDNSFAFNQTVVNSFDPNDKTCLEGTTISPSLIGQYVHYMIRFENNGTANAQNIVVKDIIDLSKFIISTLVTTNASHSFVTNITAGNKVEFIFQNINLPFDDANNDGYIAFKIKTLPTLVVGNTFTNDARIYFDYNFPIVTKLASSTFKTLTIQDFEFANYFTLYPNPAKSILNISSKETIEVKSISIYNTLGQLVLVIPNAEKVSKIDVSSLTIGNYFIKINSDQGTSNTRFIKE